MVAITHPLPAARRASRPSAATFRRRRLAAVGVLLVLAALVLLAGQLVADRLGWGEPAAPEPVARVSVVVQPGDTIWSLAARAAPGADPRPVVDAIVEANGGAQLVPGQRLELPVP
jgi:Tfp pilus assembly protein FimV